MVVCKCRKATKLYCFVHKVPVCGECICFPEHQICVDIERRQKKGFEAGQVVRIQQTLVTKREELLKRRMRLGQKLEHTDGTKVRTYSEWVIDGEYDWPPKCCSCQAVLQERDGPQTTRLGCLHVIHTNCLVSHIKSFPPHTAPAGYVCPSCSTPIWPPKSVKDSGSRLHSKLKEAIMQSGLEKNLFGNHPISLTVPPPAFTSDPLVAISSSASVTNETGTGPSKISVSDIMEIDSPSSVANYMKNSSTGIPVATTRKVGVHVERQNSELSYFADDEDGNRKKYSRRGPFRHKFLRALLPFWSSALPTLPVSAPPRKDAPNADDASEGRTRHQKHSRMDPRKILLVMAIMACMATMGILYYRIAQRGFGEEQPGDEQQ